MRAMIGRRTCSQKWEKNGRRQNAGLECFCVDALHFFGAFHRATIHVAAFLRISLDGRLDAWLDHFFYIA